MRAVFKKEFFSLFNRLYGYVSVSVVMLASAILFSLYNLTYVSENISSMLSAMAIVTALVIPVIAIALYPSKKGGDTDSIYDMMPLSVADIVLGKYFAGLSVIMLPNILIALYPMLSGFFGAVDHKASYIALLGFVLFEAAWLSVCMFISKISKTRVTAYILCYAIAVVWYFSSIVSVLIPTAPLASLISLTVLAVLIGVVLILFTKRILFSVLTAVSVCAVTVIAYIVKSSSFALLFERLIDAVSIFDQLNVFTIGIFNLQGIVLFLIVTALFVFLTWRSYSRRYVKCRQFKSFNPRSIFSAFTAFIFVLAAVLSVTVTAVVPNRFMSFDATLSGKNSVSNEAVEFLQSLDKDVSIYLLESTGNRDYELYIEKLAASSERLSFYKIYNSNTPEFYEDREISTDAISANSLIIECGDKFDYISYYNLFYYSNKDLGLSEMTYTQYSYYYNLFSSNSSYASYLEVLLYNTSLYFNADYAICSCIEYLTADIIPTNYYLTGHGEREPENSSSPYSGFGIVPLNIEDMDELPRDAASVFINMPTQDISKQDKQKLLAYLNNGGQITVVTGEENLEMVNLCEIMAEYGMSAEKGIVKQNVEADDEAAEPTVTAELTSVVHTDNDILYYLDSGTLFSPKLSDANAISMNEDAVEYLTLTPLISSPDSSFIGDDTENTASYTLACAAETPSGSRLVWFTGGESFNSLSNDASNAVVCALAWVSLEFESNVTNLPAVLYSIPVTPVTSSSAKLISIVLIAAPVLIFGMGILVFYKRKRAK